MHSWGFSALKRDAQMACDVVFGPGVVDCGGDSVGFSEMVPEPPAAEEEEKTEPAVLDAEFRTWLERQNLDELRDEIECDAEEETPRDELAIMTALRAVPAEEGEAAEGEGDEEEEAEGIDDGSSAAGDTGEDDYGDEEDNDGDSPSASDNATGSDDGSE
jgi:hypothetical protein